MQDSPHTDSGLDIVLHGVEAFAAMRRAGRLAASVLDYITPFIVPGMA